MNEMIPSYDQRPTGPAPDLSQATPRPPYQGIQQHPSQYPIASKPCTPAITLQDEMQMSEMIAGSSMVPKDYINKPNNVWVAMKMGKELGLDPLQAVQNIAVINGRPAIWGDSLLAICRASPVCEYIREHWDAQSETAICIAKRTDDPAEIQRTFSYANAKQARLWGKSGPWTQYPQRMCQMRARSWCLRDAFADALRGINCAEEVQDIPEVVIQPETDINSLNAALSEPKPTPQTEPDPTGKLENMVMDVTTIINDAATLDELTAIGHDLKDSLANVPPDVRDRLQTIYRDKLRLLKMPT